MYTNTRLPNLTVQGQAGWCLSFTQDVWGTPHIYPKAIDAWNDSGAYNHPNEYPPEVCVVVYWTYKEMGIQYGHIATYVPGQGVYSSPFNVSYGSQWFDNIDAVTARIRQLDPNCVYLGWSESLSGVQLITKGDDMAIIDGGDNWRARFNKIHHQLVGNWDMSDPVFQQIVGQDAWSVVENWSDHPNAEQTLRDQELGERARVENWEQQLIDTRQALVNAQNKPPVEVVKEVEKIVYTTDTTTAAAVQENLKLTKSIKGTLANLYGVVKKLLNK